MELKKRETYNKGIASLKLDFENVLNNNNCKKTNKVFAWLVQAEAERSDIDEFESTDVYAKKFFGLLNYWYFAVSYKRIDTSRTEVRYYFWAQGKSSLDILNIKGKWNALLNELGSAILK